MKTLNCVEIKAFLSQITGIDAPLPIISWVSKKGKKEELLILSCEQTEETQYWTAENWKYRDLDELEFFGLHGISCSGEFEGWDAPDSIVYALSLKKGSKLTLEEIREELKRVVYEQAHYELKVEVR